ncbi:hypothetical protein D3C84_936810 [compost metagenome]
MRFNQTNDILILASCQVMLRCFFDEAIILKPLCGSHIRLNPQLRLCSSELRLQKVRQQMVIAIPAALIVQRNDEQLKLFKLFKLLLTLRLACHCLAQGIIHLA